MLLRLVQRPGQPLRGRVRLRPDQPLHGQRHPGAAPPDLEQPEIPDISPRPQAPPALSQVHQVLRPQLEAVELSSRADYIAPPCHAPTARSLSACSTSPPRIPAT